MRPAQCALIWLMLAATASANPALVRVAIISDADSQNLAALVTSELSSNPDISLVERDDLAKVGDELKLQRLAGSDAMSLGKLIGADGLIFTGKGPKGLRVIFTAVGLGYTLFDDHSASDADPSQLAKSIAHLVGNYAPKLKLKPAQAIPISILNLHADFATPDSIALERKLSLLLESRLTSLPEYVVLERRHAWSLGFERSLSTTSKPLLQGVYIVDGSISLPAQGNGNVTIHLRLRSPQNQQTPLEIHGPLDDLHGLVEQITREIQKTMGATTSLPSWRPQTEAREYLQEGIWAWRNTQPRSALEALDSAELLGEKAPDLLAVRIPVLCDLGGDVASLMFSSSTTDWMARHGPNQNLRMPEDPRPDERTDQMLRAIDDMDRYKRTKGKSHLGILKYIHGPNGNMTITPDGQTSQLETQVLYASSKVLLMLDQIHHPRAEELRQALRSFAGFDPLHQRLPPNGVCALDYVDEWSESPDEALAYYHALCAIILPGNLRDDLRSILFHRELVNFCPRFAKTPQEQLELFNRLISELIADPVAKPMGLLVLATRADGADKATTYQAYVDELWRSHEQLMQADRLLEFLTPAIQLQSKISNLACPQLISLLHYYLQHTTDWGNEAYFWQPKFFPPDEAPALWKEFQDYKKRCLAYYTCHTDANGNTIRVLDLSYFKRHFAELEDNYIKIFGNPGIPRTSAPASLPALEVRQFWNPAQDTGNAKLAMRELFGVKGSPGTLWIYGYQSGYEDQKDGENTAAQSSLFKVSLPDLQTETIVGPRPIYPFQLGGIGPDIQVGPDSLYVVSNTDIEPTKAYLDRYLFSSGSWETHEITPGISKLFLVDQQIYFSVGSGLARHDWKHNQTILLASSRRRPAQNQFDDRAAYTVSDVFLAPDGKVCTQIELANYVIQETPGNWPRGPAYENYSGFPPGQTAGTFKGGPFQFRPVCWNEPAFPPDSKQGLWFRTGFDKIRVDGDIIGYGFRGNQIFALGPHQKLWWIDFNSPDPLPIPLSLKIDDQTHALLKSLYTPADLDLIEAPSKSKSAPLNLIVTEKGLCLFSQIGGFWFLPFNDIDAYLKSVQK